MRYLFKFYSKAYISIFFTCFFYLSVNAQTEWNLKKEKDGIAVYTAKLEDSKFKSIRVICELQASLTQLVAVLMQPNLQPEWVLATKEASLVKQISSARIYYYAEAALPWPMSNRDMVIDLSMSQHPITKLLTIRANTINNILPIKEGKQRVPLSQATWLVQRMPDNKISIGAAGQRSGEDPGQVDLVDVAAADGAADRRDPVFERSLVERRAPRSPDRRRPTAAPATVGPGPRARTGHTPASPRTEARRPSTRIRRGQPDPR